MINLNASDLSWKNVLDCKRFYGDINKIINQASRVGYEYFLWNGRVNKVNKMFVCGYEETNVVVDAQGSFVNEIKPKKVVRVVGLDDSLDKGLIDIMKRNDISLSELTGEILSIFPEYCYEETDDGDLILVRLHILYTKKGLIKQMSNLSNFDIKNNTYTFYRWQLEVI